jgi:beta-mannosidase
MVWQDFSMACAHYGDDERICSLMKTEAEEIVQKFRNHPALIVWSGDNECDQQVDRKFGYNHENEEPSSINPNDNKLTREIIFRVLRNHDATRPYLPSSPYLDSQVYLKGLPAENHLWGPRDFFKGDFYMKSECFFASEMGYQGCPSPSSLKKFLPQESLNDFGSDQECKNADWLTHASCMEPYWGAVYSYRVPLTVKHVVKLFGSYNKDVNVFAKQSQISQAEALKFFIEHFRISKPTRTGLLWWNIIDGWPQLSDAVVDWYGCKKLAYHYIKRT